MSKSDGKIVYPPGIRDITEEISTEELVRRLKDCSHAFQNLSQDDDNTAYIPLSLHLASESFLEHSSREIQLLVACCIADVLRIYAPDAPYKDPNQLKSIFEFFVRQLKGLEDPNSPSFKGHFYLLENLTCVKTFNVCAEYEDNQKIICSLFQVIFSIINDEHSPKVKRFMLDMLSPLITEADAVSQELLDIILIHIVEPLKSQNQNSYTLAQEILKRTSTIIEPYIQGFINNALFLSKKTKSAVSHCLYELIYELNSICPNTLVLVLPQLEFKLKSNEENERLEVTKVLARMFCDPESRLAQNNQSLWSCFLGRFTDISINVRTLCVQSSMQFLMNHPDLREDITEQLKHRQHDPEESVRLEVVSSIISTAMKDFSCVNEDLLSFVKERTLDKKFKIRREALLGLAGLYKKLMSTPNLPTSTLDSMSWIKNKLLHAYYQTSLEDRLIVERILHTSLVPYQSPMEIRMKKLYQLFVSIDDYAVKSFKEILKCQNIVRLQVKSILDIIQRDKSENRMKTVATKVCILSKSLLDPNRSKEHVSKFCKELESNLKLCNMLSVIFNGNITCSEAEIKVKEILKALGLPSPNAYYACIRQLLERIAPVLVDKEGVRYLVTFVKDSLIGDGALEAEMNLCDSSSRGLDLLHALSFVFPSAFQDKQIYSYLLDFLQTDDESAADVTLQILTLVSHDLEVKFPEIYLNLVPLLEKFVELGNVKQAKHAVYCIHAIVNDKEEFFGRILDKLEKHFTVESMYIRTALVSVGHIAFLCHDTFDRQFKDIIGKVVVKNLLMADKDLPRGGDALWEPFETLPDETKAKLEGMKMMVRWLMGLKTQTAPAYSTLRIFEKALLCDGDLMQRQHMAPKELSWMRLTAAKCLTKLCQEPNYAALLTPSQFRLISTVLSDRCYEVRELFVQKLHKCLMMLKLPLEFLAILVLGGVEEKKEFKQQMKNHIVSNINKRRDYIKLNPMPSAKLRLYQPDNVVPYVVHLLAHAPFFESYDDHASLRKVKECLWLVMEPLTTKNEEYCFAFFKRIFENIKQTKDSEEPTDDSLNFKIYAVCDLALIILMSKSASPTLKDFPVEPLLPSKYFSCVDKSYSNMKTYLPADIIAEAKLEGFQFDIFDAFIENPKGKNIESAKSEVVPSDNLTPSASGESIAENSQEADEVSSIANSASLSEASSSSVGARNLRTRGRRRIARNSPSPKTSETNSPLKAQTDSPKSSPGLNKSKTPSISESNIQNSDVSSEASSVSASKMTSKRAKTTPVMSYARTRSTRHSVATTSVASSSSESPPQGEIIESRTDSNKDSQEQVQNGLSISATAAEVLRSPDARLLIKDCNVFLNKDDVERYSSSSVTNSVEASKTISEHSSGKEFNSKSPSKQPSPEPTVSNEGSKSRLQVKKDVSVPSPTLKKRKRETSTETPSKKTKSNSSNSSSKESTSPQKSSKESTTPQRSSKQVSIVARKSPKQATSNQKVLKQPTPVSKSSLNSTPKASRSKSSVSISPVKNSRLSPKKTTKTSLVNGTRSGGNPKAAGKVSKGKAAKPKATKQSVLKKSKKNEGKQATRRR